MIFFVFHFFFHSLNNFLVIAIKIGSRNFDSISIPHFVKKEKEAILLLRR